MIEINLLILCGVLLCANDVLSFWDFAVTTNSKITFYDDKWLQITTAAHQFEQLSAIAFDEIEERIFFNDLMHHNGSIFSLKIPSLETQGHAIESILSRTPNETIVGLAYDPVDKNIYWTDGPQRKIFKISVDAKDGEKPIEIMDLKSEKQYPEGIAVDICNRALYWTNSNHKSPSIERVSLDGNKERLTITNTGLYLPHGIVVDQLSKRLFWVVDQEGSHFSVESSNLDGSNRKVIVKGLNNVPFNLAVTKDTVFWTDFTHSAIWGISKNNNNSTEQPTKIHSFPQHPKGIVARLDFIKRMENDVNCKDVVKLIKQRALQKKSNVILAEAKAEHKKTEIFCLNRGEFNALSGTCICKMGFDGVRCEINECHNHCVHGTCSLSSTGFPQCTCQEGFHGERCESFNCGNGYCLNNGTCTIIGNEPTCKCLDNFNGERCENNATEICEMFCKIIKYEPDTNMPFGCFEICTENSNQKEIIPNLITTSIDKHMDDICSDTVNKTVIVVVSGVVVSLALVLMIFVLIRRMYKPARPRIKKTFVVQKNISQTPLTSRPTAMEQCEITIENCCNMNICDTPCFDPKMLQENISHSHKKTKEDKQMLINKLDDDLY